MTNEPCVWIICAQGILLGLLLAYAEWSYRVGVIVGHCATVNPRAFPKAAGIINRSRAKHGLPPLEIPGGTDGR